MEHEEEKGVARSASGERNSGSRTLRVVGFALLMAVVSHRGDGRSVKITAAAVEGIHWEA